MLLKFMWRGLPLFLTAAVTAACTGAAAPELPVVVRDSSGVRMVEYAALSGGRLLTTAAAPLVDLGGEENDSDSQFFRVNSAGFLSDGSFVILNAGTQELRLFAANGVPLGSYGSPGDGPQEFRRAVGVAVGTGDSLFVYDAGRRRVTVLSPELAFRREVSLRAQNGDLEFGGIFGDHGLLVVANGLDQEEPENGFQQFYARYLVTDPLGEPVDSIGRFPWYRLLIIDDGRDVRGLRMFFDEPAARVAVEEAFWVGTRQVHQIEGRDRRGQLRTIIRWPPRDRTVRAEEIEAWKEAQIAEVAPERRENLQAVLDRSSFSDVYPTHGRLLAGPSDQLWVEDYRRPMAEGSRIWWVFDGDGILQCIVDLPERATLRAVSDDRVIVIELDELGVELVRVYGLIESDGAT